MPKKINRIPFIIEKLQREITTSQGNVLLQGYAKVDLRCEKRSSINVGDAVKVFSGKKVPIGTEATVKAVTRNKYEINPENNPCILLSIPNEADVWTTGKNCYKLHKLGIENKIRELDEFEFYSLDLSKEGYSSDKPVWFFKKNTESNILNCASLETVNEYIVAKNDEGKRLLKEDNENYTAVVYDKFSENYSLVTFGKKPVAGNTVSFKKMSKKAAMESFSKN